MLAQTGEFLVFDNNLLLQLQPMLATSWKPSKGGAVWTFKIRSGVKFHDGSPLTADDVVYTMQQLSDPKVASNALSTFAGVLKPAGVVKVDSSTVAFHLEAPNGNFPYLVSSDNYNAIIVPKGTDFAKWQSTFIGTGPFKLKSYSQNVGADFVANPDYWGGAPHLDSTAFTFYSSQQPQILALQGGQVDVIVQFVVTGAQALLNNSSYNIIKLKSASHRELSMRNDMAPFTDPRVRQAIALSLDRPGMVKALLARRRERRQRQPVRAQVPVDRHLGPPAGAGPHQGQAAARGRRTPHGFTTTLTTEQYEEIPELAQVITEAATKIGVNFNLKIETQTNYYGKATYGNSDWLDAIDEPGRLRRPRRAQRVSRGAADLGRPLERRPLQEQDLRRPGQAVRGRGRSPDPEDDRRQDRDAAAGRDAVVDPVLHRRADGDRLERSRRQPHVDRGDLPQGRLQVA